jgi:transcriptional regulator with XRE-family HTH domain
MLELKALRLSVGASQKEMANEMRVSLREYRELEQSGSQLDHDRLRSATFAALRIAVDREGEWPQTELFQAFEELLHLFGAVSRPSKSIH